MFIGHRPLNESSETTTRLQQERNAIMQYRNLIDNRLAQGHITSMEAEALIDMSVRNRLFAHHKWGKKDPLLGTRCWLWDGNSKPRRQGGYPLFNLSDRSCTHAVRIAYQFIRGELPPPRGSGAELSHLCQTGGACWCPWHVLEENHKQNMSRVPLNEMLASIANARKHSSANAPRKYCRRGHLMSETRIRLGTKGDTRCGQCRREQQAWRNAMASASTSVKRFLKQNNLVVVGGSHEQ